MQEDVFEGKDPVEGLEVLGRAIVDSNGVPSGSPANYEELRGKNGLPPVDIDDIKAKLAEQLLG